MNHSFWSGKRVLVTGHTGFKGGWLSLWLQKMGAELTGYALPPPTCHNLFEVARVGEGMVSEINDIRDLDSLTHVIKKSQPEIVFHLAAQPLVRKSYGDPIETYSTNVMGTVNLLEAIRLYGENVRVVVNITSDKCYENREWLWGYRENEPMGGYDPYSNSKGCAELVTACYRQSFFNAGERSASQLALASARAGNVIGGGDWAEDRLVPDVIRAIESGNDVLIRKPSAIRPWQHVLEPLCGYLILAERLWSNQGDYAEGWNFGPGNESERSVMWLVENLCRLWSFNGKIRQIGDEGLHEANYLKLDSSKARGRLGWYPRWKLMTALENIVHWHKLLQSGSDMREVTFEQIEDYEKTGMEDQ